MEKEKKKEIGYIDNVKDFCCYNCFHRDSPSDLCFCLKHEMTISLLGKCIFWIKRK
jgi:hypothetical protein